jgi:hypothetical protein
MVEQLLAAAAHPAFRGSVLPWRPIRRAGWFRAHGLHHADDRAGEDRVAVEDEVLRRRIERERLAELLHDPRRGRVFRHVEVHDLASTVPDHEQDVEEPERRRADDEEVHRGDHLAVVAEEGEPGLPGFRSPAKRTQVPRDCALGDVESEHLQLSMDPRGAPAVLGGHLADEVRDLGVDGPSPRPPAAAREPVPIELEPGAVPSHHRVRLHDHQGVDPPGPEPAEHNPENQVRGTDAGRPASRLEHRELLPASEVLQDHFPAGPEGRCDGQEDDPDDAKHGAGRWSAAGRRSTIAVRTEFWRATASTPSRESGGHGGPREQASSGSRGGWTSTDWCDTPRAMRTSRAR